MVVDDRVTGVHEDRLWIGFEYLHAPLQECGCVQVVMGGPFEVPAVGEEHQGVVIRGRTNIDGLADVPDARVARGVRPSDLRRPVGGRVVADDQLEVSVGVRQ